MTSFRNRRQLVDKYQSMEHTGYLRPIFLSIGHATALRERQSLVCWMLENKFPLLVTYRNDIFIHKMLRSNQRGIQTWIWSDTMEAQHKKHNGTTTKNAENSPTEMVHKMWALVLTLQGFSNDWANKIGMQSKVSKVHSFTHTHTHSHKSFTNSVYNTNRVKNVEKDLQSVIVSALHIRLKEVRDLRGSKIVWFSFGWMKCVRQMCSVQTIYICG